MITIFSGEFFEVISIRNLLESMNIKVFTINEQMSCIKPWIVSPGGVKPMTLKVKDEDFDKAKKLIDDYNKGILEIDQNKN